MERATEVWRDLLLSRVGGIGGASRQIAAAGQFLLLLAAFSYTYPELLKLGRLEETLHASPRLCGSLPMLGKLTRVVGGPGNLYFVVAENLTSAEDRDGAATLVRRNGYGDVVE